MRTIPFLSNSQNSENSLSFLTMQEWDIDILISKNLQRLIDKYDDGNQSAFARRFGFEPSYINGILAGDRTLGKPNMEVICKKLNIEPGEFLKTEAVVREDQAAYRYKEATELGVEDQIRIVTDAIIEGAKKKRPVNSEGKESGDPRRRNKRAG